MAVYVLAVYILAVYGLAVCVLAVYVLTVFLSRMDIDSGHDYASNSEYLSFIFSCHFGISSPSSPTLTSLSSNAGLGRRLRFKKENCIRPTYCYDNN